MLCCVQLLDVRGMGHHHAGVAVSLSSATMATRKQPPQRHLRPPHRTWSVSPASDLAAHDHQRGPQALGGQASWREHCRSEGSQLTVAMATHRKDGQFPLRPVCLRVSCVHTTDGSLKLSLSTNMIEKIAGISSLKHLKILSLGRNYVKNFAGLEAVGETLEQLWISYNLIEKIKGVNVLRKLKVLYMSNNLVKDWVEFNRLSEIPLLEDLLFVVRSTL
ncbi:uncharacterized protein LOC113204524 isoform X3 [Frankliniella occidentalis]|uniref:Uncharacterized protein LOC113204524 isoform X3 n=1 Tax=Frankliniella occidentalis TaxID=133901 RepID=A0A9C6TQH0_FRAOC|nr:uncharacterized protein LOC113204524 isoform X3 [Frankliniella occidentalis]